MKRCPLLAVFVLLVVAGCGSEPTATFDSFIVGAEAPDAGDAAADAPLEVVTTSDAGDELDASSGADAAFDASLDAGDELDASSGADAAFDASLDAGDELDAEAVDANEASADVLVDASATDVTDAATSDVLDASLGVDAGAVQLCVLGGEAADRHDASACNYGVPGYWWTCTLDPHDAAADALPPCWATRITGSIVPYEKDGSVVTVGYCMTCDSY